MLKKYQKTFSHLVTKTKHNHQHTFLKVAKNISQLTKFKLSLLNSIVACASFCIYPCNVSIIPLFFSSLSLSMSTQALNQYIEIPQDKLMIRTKGRPLVLGMNKNIALALGGVLGIAGMSGLFIYNLKTAYIGAAIWGGYLLIYTPLKRYSYTNTFIGAIIGSLPIYLGWMAAGRTICSVQPFSLFMYMMAWQYQHFYAIRFIYFDDYNNAGFKMQKCKQYIGLVTTFLYSLSILLMNYQLSYSEINSFYILNMIITPCLYMLGIKSMMKFANGQITPAKLKRDSYIHFTLIFGIILLESINRYYNNIQWKRPIKKAQGEFQPIHL